MKFSVKKGDYVKIIAGNDKGKFGQIIAVDRDAKRVTVEGKDLSVVKKAVRARKANDKSGIIELPKSMDISNVMPVCAECGQATRVRHGNVDGKSVRICAKCGAVLETKKKKEEKKKATVRRKKKDTAAVENTEAVKATENTEAVTATENTEVAEAKKTTTTVTRRKKSADTAAAKETVATTEVKKPATRKKKTDDAAVADDAATETVKKPATRKKKTAEVKAEDAE